MTKETADLLVGFILENLNNESVVFAQSFEKLDFVPWVRPNLLVTKAEVKWNGRERYTLNICVGHTTYTDMDNPAIDLDGRSITFTLGDPGWKMYRVIALIREFENSEKDRWTELKKMIQKDPQ